MTLFAVYHTMKDKKTRIGWLLSILLSFAGQNISSAQDLASLVSAADVPVIELEKGMAVAIRKTGKGAKAQAGDYVMVKYHGKLVNGKTFDQSEPNEPLVFQLGRRQVILGWELGLAELNPGSQATLYVPSQLGYGARGAGSSIPPNADLVFDVELLQVMDQVGYDQHMDQQEEKARAAFALKQRRQFQQEIQLIKNHLKTNKIKAKSLESGMSVQVKKKGKKPMATNGAVLKVAYTGYLLDGTVFDKTESGKPFEFPLGEGKVIPGWEEGLLHFGKGGQGKLIIPSKLAYGPRPITEGEITIPGNSVLIFDIKVVDISPK